ncbi:MAG: hypothetical protein V4684_08250 [Pseudomonadota bacterium]
MRQTALAIGLALAAGASLAQTPLTITAREVKGLVTVSNGTTISNVVVGPQYSEGSHFVTGAGAETTLRLSTGCEVRMTANQAITIDSRRNCEALLAALRTPGVPAGTAAATAGTVPNLSTALLVAGGLVVLTAAANSGGSGSPAPGGGGEIPTPPGGGGNIPNPPVSGQ